MSPLCLFTFTHKISDGPNAVFLKSRVYQSSAELILNQEQEMWSGTRAGPEHCPYCQRTAAAHTGKTRGTFKGYLSWEKVDIHLH